MSERESEKERREGRREKRGRKGEKGGEGEVRVVRTLNEAQKTSTPFLPPSLLHLPLPFAPSTSPSLPPPNVTLQTNI